MPTSTSPNKSRRDVLIFYITGNPGLIGYYPPFLEHLNELLAKASTSEHPIHKLAEPSPARQSPPRKYYYYASSLKGYDVDPALSPTIVTNLPDYPVSEKLSARPRLEGKAILADEQTEFKLAELEDVVLSQKRADRDLDVIIVGHSMGCYLILDMLKQLQSQTQIRQPVGTILLFPTVIDIAISHSGQTIGRLFRLPGYAEVAQFMISLLMLILPEWIILWILINFATHPPGIGSQTTAALLRTPGLIRQTVLLAKDEMYTITSDKWDESIWGAAHVPNAPKIIFFFAEYDHWVANKTREDLISLRGRKKGNSWGPQMFIDDTGIGHAFCFGHSEVVASRCIPWVLEMVGELPDDEKIETQGGMVETALPHAESEVVSTSHDITKPEMNGIKHVSTTTTREAIRV